MSENEFNELCELSWRRPLSTVEEARLQSYLTLHPELQAAWDAECALTQALEQLPQAPLSSNFTAQVLQALDAPPPRSGSWAWPEWLRFPRLIRASAVAALCLLTIFGYREYSHRQLERELAGIVSALPAEPDVFANFDTIHKLGPLPTMDEELWLALNQ